MYTAFAASIVSAQTSATRTWVTNPNAWYNYFGDHPIKTGSKWGIHVEGQWRRHDLGLNWQQLLLRTGVNYDFSKNVQVTAGYAFVNTYRYGEIPLAPATFGEHRFFEQAIVKQTLGKWNISHRYRLEQRLIDEKRVPVPGGPHEHIRWRYENRFRYMFRIARPIKGPWGIALYDEPFIAFGHNVASDVFNQNRAYAAITRTLPKSSRLEAGYMNQIIQQRNGRIFESNHILQVAIYSTFALRH